jgi:hypothetical protein
MYSLWAQASSHVTKELLCLHAPMATPSTLAWPNSHPLIKCTGAALDTTVAFE